jgi:hypothetical protein
MVAIDGVDWDRSREMVVRRVAILVPRGSANGLWAFVGITAIVTFSTLNIPP